MKQIGRTYQRLVAGGRTRLLPVLLVGAFALIALQATSKPAVAPPPAVPSWELVTSSAQSEDIERIEVQVRDGYIYITTPRSLNVKIFSILGQLISSTKVQAGTSRLKVPARGIYILKAGTFTRRITV